MQGYLFLTTGNTHIQIHGEQDSFWPGQKLLGEMLGQTGAGSEFLTENVSLDS